MRIKTIEVKIIKTPFKAAFRTTYGDLPKSQSHVIIRISDEDGFTGIGEASPLPFFTGETASIMKQAIESELGPAIIGENLFSLERIHQKMNAVLNPATGAKSAIDMALWDLKGKRLKTPVYQLIGGEKKRLFQVYALGEDTTESMAETARQKVDEGFQTIKVKVGIQPEKDIETIKQIRKVVGEGVRIRLDANQGYSVKTAIHVLQKTADYSIEYMEQPVPQWNIDGMAEIRRNSSIPIMADESLHSVHDALELIKREAVDLFGIKLIKCAGITHALKIAHLAEAAGINCVLISPWDTQIATNAGGHLATLFSSQHAQELVGPFYLTGDPFGKPASVLGFEPTEEHGFGIEDQFDHLTEQTDEGGTS